MTNSVFHRVIFILAIAACGLLQAQNSKVDSLILGVETAETDSLKIIALDKLGWEVMFRNPDTALIIGEQAFGLAKNIKDTNRIIDALNSIATAYAVQGNYTPSLTYFYQARDFAKLVNQPKDLSRIFNNIGLVYWNQGKLDSAIEVYNQSLRQFNKMDEQKGNMANTYNNLGLIHKNKGNYNLAIQNYRAALHIFDSLGTKSRGVANTINNLGIVYSEKGDLPSAMEHYLKALKMFESIGDESDGYANTLSNIGNIYKDQKDYTKALEYFTRSKAALESISNQSVALANTLNNLGSVYVLKENDSAATHYFHKALKMQESMGEKTNGLTTSLTNLGKIMESQKKYSEAKAYFEEAMNIQREIGDKKGIANSLFYLGTLNLTKSKHKAALQQCQSSYQLAVELGLLETKRNACDCLYSAYEELGNTQEAYKYYKLYIQSRDSLINKENTREITQKAMRYEFDKIQYQDSLQRAEKAKRRELEQREKDLKKEAEIQRQRIYSVAGGVGFVLMLGLAFVLFKGYKNKQKANEIISAQKAEVEQQKEAVESQKEIIEEKNREIVDSINYAKRIQNTILPTEKQINSLLKESFVFFKPKDIVSGDFYWLDQEDENIFFSSVDCTGHGVPGALVSVVGHNGLNRVLKEFKITEPAKMLDKLNLLVEESFSKNSDSSIKDGMDLSLCKLNTETLKLEFSGANNPLYVIRNENKVDEILAQKADRIMEGSEGVLYELKADKQPIGKYDFRKPFNQEEIQLKKGDNIYLFTDGYADQFGGEKGKKLMYKPFKRLLLQLSKLPLSEQNMQLNLHFSQWKGRMEQVDDVCVMGVRV